jgi:RNA-directed DNA polymerase
MSNASAHLGQRVVVAADVKDFFPSVTHRHIFHVWWKTLGCVPTIARLLTQLTSFKRHLPQGAPTSTTLANLVLHEAGAEVRRASIALGLTYTTFVDDLTFSGEKSREVLGTAAETLRKAGFRLPHRKIRIMGQGVQKKVTGAVLGVKLNVPKDKKSKARSVSEY